MLLLELYRHGFDFPDYRLSREDITMAEANWQRLVEHALRLSEQDREGLAAPPGWMRI